MEKLELKHLSPYLPYGLKYQLYGNYPVKEGEDNWITDIREISPFDFTLKKVLEWGVCKPILRPLSDLTKPITVDGDTFVPVEKLYEGTMLEWQRDTETHGAFYDYVVEMYEHDLMEEMTYSQVQQLLEWHFDIFNLLEDNLAIDINTLQ